MQQQVVLSLFFILLTALAGGLVVKLLKLPSLIGYIMAGILGGLILHSNENIKALAEVGIILLLFSVGLELSFKKLIKVGMVSLLGATLQIFSVTAIISFILSLFGLPMGAAIILGLGFSLSSTAVVVKLLVDRAETETIHGQLMIGWLLTQDLAVIPMFVVLPLIAGTADNVLASATKLSLSAVALIITVFLLGKFVVPYITKLIAQTNSKELLLLGGVSIALGMGALSLFFGVSAALGAFLAGVVISESQENHAIFSETRPLRDLFVILFFVTLGFLVNPVFIFHNLPLIIGLALLVMIVKIVIVFVITQSFGYRGKTALIGSIGLAQVGEFAFVLLLSAQELGIISEDYSAIGIGTVLLTLLFTPILYKLATPLWRKVRHKKPFSGWNQAKHMAKNPAWQNHIIICGYGRVGRWVGKGLQDAGIEYVAIDYNQQKVQKARKAAVNVIYGDPVESQVLEMAGVREARAVIIALPDQLAQEEIVAYVQTVSPKTKIIARTSSDQEYRKLKHLRVKKVVQPEFEAAISILRSLSLQPNILSSLRKSHGSQVG